MLVYFDTNLWIYAFEKQGMLGDQSRRLFAEAHTKGHRLAASLFVLNEVMVGPARSSDRLAALQYRLALLTPRVQLLPFTAETTDTYANLRALHGLKSLDALHLSTAALGKVDLFVTHDASLLSKQVPGIGAIVDLSVTLP